MRVLGNSPSGPGHCLVRLAMSPCLVSLGACHVGLFLGGRRCGVVTLVVVHRQLRSRCDSFPSVTFDGASGNVDGIGKQPIWTEPLLCERGDVPVLVNLGLPGRFFLDRWCCDLIVLLVVQG